MTAPNPAPRPDDGGPAFPYDTNDRFVTGMTLRDYFAAAALTGVIHDCRAEMQRRNEWLGMEDEDSDGADLIAAQCYVVADAMLAARAESVTP
jgi:hypothetical protein